MTPPPVRRLARIARFGARIPPTPDYAAALVAIGPAAIKLGQALSTRPDLVGDEAAANLSQLQDDLPPAPFAAIRQTIEASFGAPLDSALFRIRRDPGRRRLDRPGPPRGHDRGPRRSRSRCSARDRGGIRQGDRNLRMGRGARRALWRRGRAASPAAGRRPVQANGRRASSTCSAKPLRPPSCARTWSPSPAIMSPRSTGGGPPAGSSRMEWLDGIKLNDREALIAAGQDARRSPRPWSGPSSARRWSTASSTPTFTTAICSPCPTAGSRRSISASWAGSTAARGCGWPRSSTASSPAITARRRNPFRGAICAAAPQRRRSSRPRCAPPASRSAACRSRTSRVGRMLESLFSITRDFDMPTQPHLLLLQKTMVMNEGVATALDPDINMWEAAEPFLTRMDALRARARGLLCRPHHRADAGGEENPRADQAARRILSAEGRRAAPAAVAGDRSDRAGATGGAMRLRW